MLPFSRWINYCSLGYFISASTAAHQFSKVLPLLRIVGSRHFARKRAAASLVRDAFFYKGAHLHGREPSGLSKSAHLGAEDFVLGEICHRAREYNARMRASINGSTALAEDDGAADVLPVATRLDQCLLMAAPLLAPRQRPSREVRAR
jgi:hypothetical protein